MQVQKAINLQSYSDFTELKFIQAIKNHFSKSCPDSTRIEFPQAIKTINL